MPRDPDHFQRSGAAGSAVESRKEEGLLRGVKAVILDVYHTLLRVEPGPPDSAAHWEDLWRITFPGEAWLEASAGSQGSAGARIPAWNEFQAACLRAIEQVHADKKREGITHPEVAWSAIARAAAPGLMALDDPALQRFLNVHAALERTCSAMPGALEFLKHCARRGLLTGIASNAQAYTLAELRDAGIAPERFDPELCFWSWREGFSKPDGAVFQFLTNRLSARGVVPGEILMIGDRLDNDILPARAAGWRTFHFQGLWPGW